MTGVKEAFKKIYKTVAPPSVQMRVSYYFQYAKGFQKVKNRFKTRMLYDIDLKNPRTFNEKLTHRKLFCRDRIWIEVTDKVEVRNWLRKNNLICADLKLIPKYGVFESYSQLRDAILPEKFIAKAAWASGLNCIVRDLSSDRAKLHLWVKKWFDGENRYGVEKLIWPSAYIPRRIIIEELLVTPEGCPPDDFKFFVFHGRVEFFQVDYDRFQNHQRNIYNREKEFIPVEKSGIHNSQDRKLPNNIENMISVAERIGKHFDFARIDLYYFSGEIYFGEITMTPANGAGRFSPQEFDFVSGGYWKYPPQKI